MTKLKVLYLVPWKIIPCYNNLKTDEKFLLSRPFPEITAMMFSEFFRKQNIDFRFYDLSYKLEYNHFYNEKTKSNICFIGDSEKNTIKIIKKFSPNVILVSSMFTVEVPIVFHLIKLIKQNFGSELKIIIGGKNVNSVPYWYGDLADLIFVGEDITLLTSDIINKVLLKKLDNKFFFSTHKKNFFDMRLDFSILKEFYFIENTVRSTFHYPEWVLNNIEKNKNKNVGVLYNERGCPFNCKYCSVTNIDGKAIRKKSFEIIMKDFVEQYFKYNIKIFQNSSDLFAVTPTDISFLNEFKKIRESDKQLSIINTNGLFIKSFYKKGRLNKKINEEKIDLLISSGLTTFTFAVESFNLKYASKVFSDDKLYELLKSVKEKGGKTEVYMIYGFPNQTESELYQDIRKIDKMRKYIDAFVWRFLEYFPGTKYFNELLKYKKLSLEDYFNLLWEGVSFYNINNQFNLSRIPTKRLIEIKNKLLV